MMTFKEHLELLESFGSEAALLVIKHGVYFTEVSDRKHPSNYNTMKECYANAFQHASMDRDNLTYCEGYALTPGVPMPLEHAWCVDSEGKVFDPTWKDSKACKYFGVAFKNISFVTEFLLETEHYGIFCSLWLLSSEKRSIFIARMKDEIKKFQPKNKALEKKAQKKDKLDRDQNERDKLPHSKSRKGELR